jgi:hypothetical protein
VDFNRYAYAGNDPVNQSDANGHAPIPCAQCYAGFAGADSTMDIDEFQTSLDIAGFAGPVGPFADALNSVISAGRGNWGEAGLNAAAMVPFLGDAAKAANMTKKALKSAGNFEMHHILPQSFKNNPFLKEIGFDINGMANKMLLPKDIAAGTARTIHNGRQWGSYTRQFDSLVRDLDKKVQAGVMSKQEALSILKSRVSQVRGQLKNNELPLNKASLAKPSSSSSSSSPSSGGKSGSTGSSGSGKNPCYFFC